MVAQYQQMQGYLEQQEHDKQFLRHKNAETVHILESKISNLEQELSVAQRQAFSDNDHTIEELKGHIQLLE